MTNGLEYRGEVALGAITDVHPGDHTFSLRIVNYNGGPLKRADSYGSVWAPGVFSESLGQKMPSAAWAHDWSRIIGSLKEHDERADGLDGLVQFANMDEVPDAKMAWSLIRDKHIRDTSFGFKRIPGGWDDTRSSPTKIDGEKERLRNARLDEVSPVLVGAVHGAGVLAVRAENGDTIAIADAAELLAKMASGQVTLRDALEALEARAGHVAPEVEEQERHDADMAFELTYGDVQDALDGMRRDGLIGSETRAVGVSGVKGEAVLKEYWSHGKGAAKVAWGTPGDHTRCVAELSKYVGPKVVHGLCTNIQKLAIGHAGNPTAAERAESGREPETEPSPT